MRAETGDLWASDQSLNDTTRHFAYPISPQHIPAVDTQAAAGHERGVAQDKVHRPDHIVHAAGAAQKRMVADGLFFGGTQETPAAGIPPVAGINHAQDNFVDPYFRRPQTGPGLGEQACPATGRGVPFVEKQAGRPGAAHDPGDGRKVNNDPITALFKVGQGRFVDPLFGPEGGGHFQVPLLACIAAMYDGPAPAFDVVDQDVQPAETAGGR